MLQFAGRCFAHVNDNLWFWISSMNIFIEYADILSYYSNISIFHMFIFSSLSHWYSDTILVLIFIIESYLRKIICIYYMKSVCIVIFSFLKFGSLFLFKQIILNVNCLILHINYPKIISNNPCYYASYMKLSWLFLPLTFILFLVHLQNQQSLIISKNGPWGTTFQTIEWVPSRGRA